MEYRNILILFLIIVILVLVYRLIYQISLDSDIHENLFSNLPASGEIAERISANANLLPTDFVLEIGANRGGVTQVIANKLKYPHRQLVSVEPTSSFISSHDQIRKKYNINYNLFTGVVVPEDTTLHCVPKAEFDYSECNCVEDRSKTTTVNKTVQEIEQFYNIKFTALVIDCEGCYVPLFKEWIKTGWIKQIRVIIIEWDETFATICYRPHMEQELIDAGFVLSDQRNHKLLWHGVRSYINKNY